MTADGTPRTPQVGDTDHPDGCECRRCADGPWQRGGAEGAVDREARETDDEQGVRLLGENRDYWRGLAESRTADLRDLRAAVRGALGITGPASDDDLMTALAARGDAAPTVTAEKVREVVDRYVQADTDPPSIEPEDGWRLVRDLRALIEEDR